MKPPIGRVYVLSNPSIQGLVKIGFTMNTVEGRVKELSSATGIPTDFEIEYQVECRDPENIEKLVHSFLQNKRHNERREFFCVSAIEAAQAVRKHTTEILDEESRIDFSGIENIKKTASEYKRESQSINNWEEIECIYWKTFISRSHYFRDLKSIVLWQMISVHSNKKMKGFQSSVSKKRYWIQERVFQPIYDCYYSLPMGTGEVILDSLHTEKKLRIVSGSPADAILSAIKHWR